MNITFYTYIGRCSKHTCLLPSNPLFFPHRSPLFSFLFTKKRKEKKRNLSDGLQVGFFFLSIAPGLIQGCSKKVRSAPAVYLAQPLNGSIFPPSPRFPRRKEERRGEKEKGWRGDITGVFWGGGEDGREEERGGAEKKGKFCGFGKLKKGIEGFDVGIIIHTEIEPAFFFVLFRKRNPSVVFPHPRLKPAADSSPSPSPWPSPPSPYLSDPECFPGPYPA